MGLTLCSEILSFWWAWEPRRLRASLSRVSGCAAGGILPHLRLAGGPRAQNERRPEERWKPRPGVRLRLDETTAWRAGGAAPLGPVRGLRSRDSISGVSPAVHGVVRGRWSRVGARPAPGGDGPCCSSCWSPSEQRLQLGRCWAKVSSPGSWPRLSPAPRHSKCRRWVSSSRGTDGGAGAGAGSGGGGRSCGGAGKGHLLAGYNLPGDSGSVPRSMGFGAVWTEYTF